MTEAVSNCCGSSLRVAGRTTQWWACTMCGSPCDAVPAPTLTAGDSAMIAAPQPDLAPPDHAGMRAVLAPPFTPETMEAVIRVVAHCLSERRQGLTWEGVIQGLRDVLADQSEDAIPRAWQRSRILDAVEMMEANPPLCPAPAPMFTDEEAEMSPRRGPA